MTLSDSGLSDPGERGVVDLTVDFFIGSDLVLVDFPFAEAFVRN